MSNQQREIMEFLVHDSGTGYRKAFIRTINGEIPLTTQDQFGNTIIYDPKTKTFENIDLGTIITVIKVIGPLVVKYIVPFVKDLISGLQDKPSTPNWDWSYNTVCTYPVTSSYSVPHVLYPVTYPVTYPVSYSATSSYSVPSMTYPITTNYSTPSVSTPIFSSKTIPFIRRSKTTSVSQPIDIYSSYNSHQTNQCTSQIV